MFLIQSMQINIVFIVDKLENFRLKINVKEERKKEKRTLDNSTINIFMSRGMGSRYNESFTDNFCSYDFTGIFHNDESSDDSDSKKQPVLLQMRIRLASQQTFVLKTSLVFVFRSGLQDVLIKTNIFNLLIRLQKMSSRRLHQDQYIHLGHTSSRRLQDVFKTSSKHLQDVFKML